MKRMISVQPNVTVLVTTKNNEETILECVSSILNSHYPKDKLKVLVVDASENQSTSEILQGLPAKIVSYNGNAPAAYNFALTLVQSDLVGFVDGDAKVTPDWLSEITKGLEDENVAGATGQIRTWNNHDTIPRCIGYELESRYNNPKKVVRTSTTNLVLKRKVLEEVAGFDETLDTGYDADIGFRIAARGYKLLFESDAVVFHFHRSTLWSYLKQQYRYAKNDARLYAKDSRLLLNDNVTTKWMIVQPMLVSSFVFLSVLLLLLPVVASNISTVVQPAITPAWIALGLVWVGSYGIASAKLAFAVNDVSALPALLCILLARSVAWSFGGLVGVAGYILFRVR